MNKTYQQQVVMKDLSQYSMIYLVPLADFHIGNKDVAVDVIKGYVDWVKSHNNAFTILNGDMMECATKDSTPELYDALVTPDMAYAQVRELLEPIKKKILMITRGNHEESIYRRVGCDYTARLAYDLGDLPYKPDGGMLGLRLGLNSHHGMCYIYATHGWGGARTIGAKVKKAQDLMLVADAQVYVLSHDHCFSEDTEILTRGGWKSFTELIKGEELLTLKTGKKQHLEYKPLEDIFIYDNFNELINIKGKSVDLLVTPLHTLLYRGQDNRNKKERWHKGTAEYISLLSYQREVPVSSSYETNGIALGDNFIKLITWLVSEAHFHEDSAGIRIGQLRGKHERIQKLLDDLNIDYSLVWAKTSKNKDYAQFNIRAASGRDIRKIMPDKRLPPIIQEMDNRQFKLFLKELSYGDGWRTERYICYATKDSILAGQLQALVLKHGYTATITSSGGMYSLTFIEREASGITSFKRVPYKGKVWCVSVPNHTVIIRRNGKVTITGNTQNVNRGNILEPPRSKLNFKRANYMTIGRRLFINTGAFITYNGYIQRKGYTPQDLGTPRIRIELKKDHDDYYLDLHTSI